MEEKTWSVYRHTFPNGKVYIGVSCHPEERWDNGMGYAPNQPMFRDIVMYGWRNIAHEILFDGLSEAEAHDKERELIGQFGKKGREKTYNRQFAEYVQPERNCDNWLDVSITEETLSQYKNGFAFLDDCWLEPYIQQMHCHPLGADLGVDGIAINFFSTEDDEYLVHDVLRADYPREGMTFREVYEWLRTAPSLELVRMARNQLTDEMKSMLRGEI